MNNIFFVLTFSIITLIAISVNPAFADNPTPHGEWDIDMSFSEASVRQLPTDLHRMEIAVKAEAIGTMPESTVNIYADITTPSGTQYTKFGTISDIPRGESKILRLATTITEEGRYDIDIRMTSVGDFTDHIFDEIRLDYTVTEHGFEKTVTTVGTDDEVMICYQAEDATDIRHDEALHASIDIGDNALEFEKIVVTHGDYKRDFPIDTKDIYMKSRNGHYQTQVHLLKEGNLFPLAYAGHGIHDYLQFYKVDKDECGKLGCFSVNATTPQEPFEFEVWYLVFLGVFAVIPVMIKRKNKKSEWGQVYVESERTV